MGLVGLAIAQVNERLSSSLTKFQPKIANHVSKRTPLLDLFMKRKKVYSGGTEVGVRIRSTRSGKLGEVGGTSEFSYYDELSTKPTDTVKAIGERWSNFHHPIALSHEEMYENDGEKAFDRLKENTGFAMDDLAEDVDDAFWGISGGDGNKLPTSITDVISGTDSLTLYGIAKTSTTNTHMNSQQVTSVGDLETELLDAVRKGSLLAIDNSGNKSNKIDAWITHLNVYLGLEKVLPQYIHVASTSAADLGFDEILFNKVPIRWSSSCPLDSNQKYQMFGLMLKFWEFAVRAQWNFKTTKFVDMLPKQAASVSQLFLGCALVCNMPRAQVRINGIDL